MDTKLSQGSVLVNPSNSPLNLQTGPVLLFLCLLLTSSFLFFSSPLFILFFSFSFALLSATTRSSWQNPREKYSSSICFLPSSRSLARPGSAPVDRTKSDRTASMSRVMWSWVCAAHGAAVALVDASLHVLIWGETKQKHLTALFYCKLVQPHLSNLTLSCETTQAAELSRLSLFQTLSVASACLCWSAMLHADDSSWFCEERHIPSTPPILCQQSQLKSQHRRWNTNNTASCLSLDTPACSQKPLTHITRFGFFLQQSINHKSQSVNQKL